MKLMLVSFSIFGLTSAYLTCDCGWETEGTVVHGYKSRKGEYPWMVAIQKIYRIFPFCSGTIVTPWHVITSGQCVWSRDAEDLIIIAGANDLDSPASEFTKQYHSVNQIIVHPSFNKTTLVDDIAILVTRKKIEFTEFIGPACFPRNHIEIFWLDVKFISLGWEKYDPRTFNEDGKKLRRVHLALIEYDRSKNMKEERIKQLYTTALNNDTSKVNSGDPLIWNDGENDRLALVGVVSKPHKGLGNYTEPGVNTCVSFYLPWIIKQIKSSKPGTKACQPF